MFKTKFSKTVFKKNIYIYKEKRKKKKKTTKEIQGKKKILKKK